MRYPFFQKQSKHSSLYTLIITILLLLSVIGTSVFTTCPIAYAFSSTGRSLCFKKNSATSDHTELDITAKAAVLIENDSGRILYEKSKDTELIPASITKIMTLLLIFDALDQKKITLKDTVSVSEYASQMGGSQVF